MVRDTISGLTEQMNRKPNEADTMFSTLLADLVPVGQNSDVSTSVAQPIRHKPDSVEPPIECGRQRKRNHTNVKWNLRISMGLLILTSSSPSLRVRVK